MHTYRNRVTGVSFDTNCVCKGRDWELVPSSPVDKMRDLTALMPKVETAKPKKTRKGTTK